MESALGGDVLAVVSTYRPSADLLELLKELAEQVSTIVVTDDASRCTSDPLLQAAAEIPEVTVIRHSVNAGIARGLNDGLAAAQSSHAPWLLTIDQDSQVSRGYVQSLVRIGNDRISHGEVLGAIGAETIDDRAGEITYPHKQGANGPVTEELIQTGTLWSVNALTQIGGFDEALGIDAVDAAACLRLRERGFAIAVAPGTRIGQSIGQAQIVTFMGRRVMVTGHSPARRTSMLRNRLRLFPAEFRQSPRHAIRTMRRVMTNQALGLIVEEGKVKKAQASLKGLLPKRAGSEN